MRNMPAPGFKSITVKDDVYGYFFKKWKKEQKKLRREKGITSFSGYVSYLLSQMIEQEEKRSSQ